MRCTLAQARARVAGVRARIGCERRTMMSSMSSAVSVSVMSRNCNGGVRGGPVAPLHRLLHVASVALLSIASVALLSVARSHRCLLHGRTVARSHRYIVCCMLIASASTQPRCRHGPPGAGCRPPPHLSRTRPPRPVALPARRRAADGPPAHSTNKGARCGAGVGIRKHHRSEVSAVGSFRGRTFRDSDVSGFGGFGIRKFRDLEVSAFHCLSSCQPRTLVRSPAEPLPAPVRI